MCFNIRAKLNGTKIKDLPARGHLLEKIHSIPFLKQLDELNKQEICNSKIIHVKICLEGLGT